MITKLVESGTFGLGCAYVSKELDRTFGCFESSPDAKSRWDSYHADSLSEAYLPKWTLLLTVGIESCLMVEAQILIL
jgi:hypothetical protein